MPQLDPTFFPSQIFWLTVTFLVLYIALAKFVLPGISDVLQGRQRKIGDDLEKAEYFRKEAEQAEKSYKAELDRARNEAGAVISSAASEAGRHVAERQAELDKILQRKAADAEQRIQQAKVEACGQLEIIVSELVPAALGRLASIKTDEKQLAAAVKGALRN